MIVGIPLCELGACLQPVVEVVRGIPLEPDAGENQVVLLWRPLPLCEVHYTMLHVWRGRYQADPGCRVRIG